MRPSGIQAILHVGDMKCGSTSIQEWMSKDADILQSHGFWRSQATCVVHYDSRLSSYALDDNRLETEPRKEAGIWTVEDLPAHRQEVEHGLAADVRALPPEARGMLFSHELLLMLQPHEVRRVVSMLRGLFSGIRVVAYIRRQDRLFLSLWGQRLKSSHPGPDFFDHLLEHRSYLRMLETWEKAVGRENLVVRVFDKAAFAKGDLQADFRASAGIPSDERYSQPHRTNESLDGAAQTLLLELGERIARRRLSDRRRLLSRFARNFLPKRKRSIAQSITLPTPLTIFLAQHRTGRGLQPDRRWAEGIVAACEQENERIRQRYFPERSRLFDDDFSDYPSESRALDDDVRIDNPDVLRHPAIGAPGTADVAEAYRVVFGREPASVEIDRERQSATNIAHLYASLLTRQRAA